MIPTETDRMRLAIDGGRPLSLQEVVRWIWLLYPHGVSSRVQHEVLPGVIRNLRAWGKRL